MIRAHSDTRLHCEYNLASFIEKPASCRRCQRLILSILIVEVKRILNAVYDISESVVTVRICLNAFKFQFVLSRRILKGEA